MAGRVGDIARKALWVLVAWPAPAVIAGLAGWNGIWGSGSALGDYLIPIPVAGGSLHVPTFVAATILVFAFGEGRDRTSAERVRWLGPVLAALTVCGLAMLIDLERLARPFVSDAPFRLRFEKNALALFVTTDFGLALLWTRGPRISLRTGGIAAAAAGVLLLGWQGYR